MDNKYMSRKYFYEKYHPTWTDKDIDIALSWWATDAIPYIKNTWENNNYRDIPPIVKYELLCKIPFYILNKLYNEDWDRIEGNGDDGPTFMEWIGNVVTESDCDDLLKRISEMV